MERVERYFHPIIIEDILAAVEVGADLARVAVEANEDEIKVLRVVAQVSVSALGAWLAVAGLVLDEIRDVRHVARDRGMRFHALEIRQRGRAGQPRNLYFIQANRIRNVWRLGWRSLRDCHRFHSDDKQRSQQRDLSELLHQT